MVRNTFSTSGSRARPSPGSGWPILFETNRDLTLAGIGTFVTETGTTLTINGDLGAAGA